MKQLLAVASLLTAACLPPSGTPGPNQDSSRRNTALESGIKLRHGDPIAAAGFFADAGAGSELERLRFELWLGCLQRGPASIDDWLEYLAQGPPSDLADSALLEAAELEAQAGKWRQAEAHLALVSADSLPEADLIRLTAPDSDVQAAAARRLAVTAPADLRAADRSLEQAAVDSLSPSERIERAVAWRLDGHPRQSSAELRRLKTSGDLEQSRRLEQAQSELAAGSTTRAISALPRLSGSNGAQAVVHAEAWRRRGWSRFPKNSARDAFGECLVAARRARTVDPAMLVRALEIELECATEAGRLDLAAEAWKGLARNGWRGGRRSWLGRRLGIALVEKGADPDVVELLANSVPDDERCLQFWMGRLGSDPDDEHVMVADLYGLWVREDVGGVVPREIELAREIVALPPPPSVSRLIALGEPSLASQEWRRVRRSAAPPPGETLTAAEFEFDRGRPDLAIRWLRRGFADLGTVNIARAPANAVRAYLPLSWPDAVRSAAAEAGIEPWLLAGLARQESIFNATARSPAGALGVVQLLRGTARPHAVALGLGSSPDLFDPAVNLRLGARELAGLLARFKAVEPALAAYNAGETRSRRWVRQWSGPRVFTEHVPIPETYSYIRRVRYLAEAYRLVWAEEWPDTNS